METENFKRRLTDVKLMTVEIMTKRRIILVSVVFFSITVFTVQTLPRTRSSNRTIKPPGQPDNKRLRNMTAEERKKEREKRREELKLYSERLRNMTEAERKREAAKRWREGKLEYERRRKESMGSERSPQKDKEYQEQMRIEREQWGKEIQERIAQERKRFFHEKCALRPTEEQWKLIKPKLEKVRHLSEQDEQARSTVGLILTSSSSSGAKTRDSRSRSKPIWQWKISWKDKAPAELTEAQKIANELIDLVDSKSTKAEEFKNQMDALRKSRSKQRSKQDELNRQLSKAKARQELREVLTPRQEAALELWIYRWL